MIGFNCRLTCSDRFSRWPEAISIVETRSLTFDAALFSGWTTRFERTNTEMIIMDGGF